MYTLCWSAKGGSGTTVVAAALAILAARHGPTMLIDLGGDSAPALGTVPPDGPGVGDWLSTPAAPADRLWQLAHDCGPDLQLVPPGTMPTGAELTELAARTAGRGRGRPCDLTLTSIIDAGSVHADPGPGAVRGPLAAGPPAVLPGVAPRHGARRHRVPGGRHRRARPLPDPHGHRARAGRRRGRRAAVGSRPSPAAVDAGLLQARLPSSVSRPLAKLRTMLDAPMRRSHERHRVRPGTPRTMAR